tara:strand:- start:10 stop:1014 length:1005 start_codon:yes stop_codon:yes gene_type:complete
MNTGINCEEDKMGKFNWGAHEINEGVVKLAGYGKFEDLESCQKYCKKIAKSNYENFIISNWFTPKEIKQHIQNIYAFCRYGDDLGDDAPFPPKERILLLNEWMDDLERGYGSKNDPWNGSPRHPIIKAVSHTAKEFKIPITPFKRLIEAFKFDQEKTRYNNYKELKNYCIHSADPVGHLFLYIYGYKDEKLQLISDNTCTALQLANHWQDVDRDLDQNRIYMPIEDMEQFGYSLEDYQNRIVNDEWRALMRFQVDRARKLFEKGSELWEMVDSRLVVDLRMFTMGGLAVLDSIEAQGYDTWSKRPKISKLKQFKMLMKSRKLWKEAHKKGKGMR